MEVSSKSEKQRTEPVRLIDERWLSNLPQAEKPYARNRMPTPKVLSPLQMQRCGLYLRDRLCHDRRSTHNTPPAKAARRRGLGSGITAGAKLATLAEEPSITAAIVGW